MAPPAVSRHCYLPLELLITQKHRIFNPFRSIY